MVILDLSTLVYRIDVQYEINVQVGKFLKNIKHAGQNRHAGGNFFSKSVNVQTKIRPCRGDFFLKINKLALKKALIFNFNDSMMVSEFSLSFLPSIAILQKAK